MSHNIWTIFLSISFILRHDNGTENKMEQHRSVLTENKIQWNKKTQGQIRRKKRFRWSNLYFNDPRYLQGSIGSHICLPIPVDKRRIRACKQRICAQSWGIKLNYSSDFFHKKTLFVRVIDYESLIKNTSIKFLFWLSQRLEHHHMIR